MMAGVRATLDGNAKVRGYVEHSYHDRKSTEEKHELLIYLFSNPQK